MALAKTKLHERVINIDVFDGKAIDIVNVGAQLPFRDSSVDLVVSQEVLEHVDAPANISAESFRILKPGGVFFCQVPFIIGYHPGPTDYWRFTCEGLPQLFQEQPWEIQELSRTLGHGSGTYRILVEFMAVNASIISHRLYRPGKAFFVLLLYPLQWLDCLTRFSKEADRIPGGYFCIAQKSH